MLLRTVPFAERRREHAEVAVGGAVARDEVADHHGRARERLELRVDERGDGVVPQRSAGVGEVGQRAEPQRLAEVVEPFGGDA